MMQALHAAYKFGFHTGCDCLPAHEEPVGTTLGQFACESDSSVAGSMSRHTDAVSSVVVEDLALSHSSLALACKGLA